MNYVDNTESNELETLQNQVQELRAQNRKLTEVNTVLQTKLEKAKAQAQGLKEQFEAYEQAESDDPMTLYLQAKVEALTEGMKQARLGQLFARLGIKDQTDDLGDSLFDLFCDRVKDAVDVDNQGNLVYPQDGTEAGFLKRFKINKMNQQLFYSGGFADYDFNRNPRARLTEADLLGTEFPVEQPFDYVQAILDGTVTVEPPQDSRKQLPTMAEPLIYDKANRRYLRPSEVNL